MYMIIQHGTGITAMILDLQHPTIIEHGYVTISKYFCIGFLVQSFYPVEQDF